MTFGYSLNNAETDEEILKMGRSIEVAARCGASVELTAKGARVRKPMDQLIDHPSVPDSAQASMRSLLVSRVPDPPSVNAPAIIDLGLLAPPDGFVIQGANAEDIAGWSVSDAGDVNGDGFGDVIVGAPFGDEGGVDAGEAYVIFGQAGGFANIDLGALAAADGFIIKGDAAGDTAGRRVASAGDINGDGFDDVIVGALYGDDGGASAGEAYVVFGKASGFGPIDLGNLAAADGFIIVGDAAGDRAGTSVSVAGDVNGDGFDDIIVGAAFGDHGGYDAGDAYVIFGKAGGFGTIDLGALAPGAGFAINGDAAGDNAGYSVSDAGDVNGDGFDDVIVGARRGGGSDVGEAYVIFGKASGFATIDLGNLAAVDGFAIVGDTPGGYAGFSVSSAGDVNGDGFDDVVVGAPYDGGNYEGAAYVVFGKAGGFGTIDLGSLTAAQGFAIIGDFRYDYAGLSVSSAGDVNGDGFGDVIVAAPYADGGGSSSGEAYLIYGKASGFGTIDLASLDEADGFILVGDTSSDRAGYSVSAAGDVNGDGLDDLIVGARGGDNGGNNAGEAYVIFGFTTGAPTIPGGASADSLVGGAADEVLEGKGGSDTLQGNGGGDTLDGGAGNDWADYRAGGKVRADLKSAGANTGDAAGDAYVSIENLRGSNKADKLYGDDFANRIEGRGGADVLSGRDGKDTLAGGAGVDTLTGGGQNDYFELASTSVADADVISDFAIGDLIALDSDVFGIPEGALAPGRFVAGGAAQDGNDRLIYKAGQGKLYFDPDGTGAQAQVLIATLNGAPALSANDIVVI